MKLEIVTLDEETAREWQARVVEYNRTPAMSTYGLYATDMFNGDWLLNGSSIKFNEDGECFDGGHRFAALILANAMARAENKPPVTIQTVVAWGADREAFIVTDGGRGRSGRDTIQSASKGKFNGRVAALVRWHYTYTHGNPMNVNSNAQAKPTRVQLVKWWEEDPEGFETSLKRGVDIGKYAGGPVTGAGLFHYLMKSEPKIGEVGAEDFFDRLVSGANHREGSPILQLREKFAGRRITSAFVNLQRYTSQEMLYLFHRAWEMWGTDKWKRLALNSRQELNNKTFPKLWVPNGEEK